MIFYKILRMELCKQSGGFIKLNLLKLCYSVPFYIHVYDENQSIFLLYFGTYN